MHELSCYVVSPLRDGDIALYRGSGTGLSPILLVAAEETSPGSVERLEHEYALKCELDPGWAARPMSLTHYNDRLVLEDPGGAPLDRLLGRPLDVSPFLRIAIPRNLPSRYAAASHVLVSRHGSSQGPIDEPLKLLKFERRIATIVGGFATALALAWASDLVASVPERHTSASRAGMVSFALPFPVPEILVSMMWHPRLDADIAHRWLRGCVRDACAGRPALHVKTRSSD